MTFFIQMGDSFRPTPTKDAFHEGLPLGVYTVELDQAGLFFQRGLPFAPINKLYGDTEKSADRIVRTFLSRTANTGVLLSGEKGSGKSLLGRVISERAAAEGMPTVMINKPFNGADLQGLLSTLEVPTLFFLDEFEKVFSTDEAQEPMLSLLDGTMGTKHLFVLTVNNMWKVNEHFKNRPGRLYYHLSFEGLDSDFVREYGEDNLENKEHMDELLQLAELFEEFNFDMLKAVVEESNRYGEPPLATVKMLNVTPSESEFVYAVTITDKKNEVVEKTSWRGNTLFIDYENRIWLGENGDEISRILGDSDEDYIDHRLTPADLASYTPEKSVFKTNDGYTYTFVAQGKPKSYHWTSAL